MAEVTVGELAKSIGAPIELLLRQMHEAGLEHKGAEAKVSDDEKQRLLNFLKSSHEKSASDPKKINLQRKTTTTIKSPKGNARKVHDVEVRKKRTYIKREDENVDSGSSAISDEINNEIGLSDYAEVLDKHTLGGQSVEAGSDVEGRLSVDNSRLGSDSDDISKSGMSTASVEEPSDQIEIQSGINNVLDEAVIDDSGLTLERLNFEATGRSHPEIPAKEDKLNRQKLVNALAVNLVSPTNNHHRAIGLLGEWGSGKSTVLDLLKQRLQESNSEQPFIFGEFNAWAYEHTDNIQAGVAQEMINALTGSPDVLQPLYAPTASFFEKLKTILSSDLRKIFAAILNAIPVSSNMSLRWLSERCALTLRFAYKVHPVELLKILVLLLVAAMPWFSEWFQSLIEFSESSNNKNSWIWTGGVFLYTLREFGKLIISPQAKELLTYLRLPSYAEHLGTIPVMRKHICTLCNLRLKQKNGKTPRLLFVVDDLDRCSPSAIVKVLEAVRLVLDLDNVIVIIAIDQHIALAALSEHFKDFSPHHKLKNSHAIAREYLSKVINLPIVLTKPSGDDVRVFMGSFWEEMNKTVEKEINERKPQLETADITSVSEGSGVSAAVGGRLDEGNMTQHASMAGDKSPDTLATDTVDLDGSGQSNAEVEPPPMMKPVKALSKDQQESFIHWVNYFELSNSRQLKRLNNSYDLMRSYVPLMDKEVFEFEFAESAVSKVYPMLLTLILMEYLNSLHDLKERNQLWDQLFSESTASPDEGAGNKLVNSGFINAYRNLLAAEGNQSLVANVEAFVLPAMN